MAALLLKVQPGDEVIIHPILLSRRQRLRAAWRKGRYSSIIRGGQPQSGRDADRGCITPRTRAIVPVHYAGVACEMDTIIPSPNAMDSKWWRTPLKAPWLIITGERLVRLATWARYSFHDSKNIISGEGGSLLINDLAWRRGGDHPREGNDRSRFFRGRSGQIHVQESGPLFARATSPAFLWAADGRRKAHHDRGLAIWQRYHEMFASLEATGRFVGRSCPRAANTMPYVLYSSRARIDRRTILDALNRNGIGAYFI